MMINRVIGLILTAAIGLAAQSDPVVPMAKEPRHPVVFEAGSVRVHDVRIPPGDTSLYHVHDVPVLYVILSASPLRSQVLGKEWSGGPRPGAPAAPSSAPAARVSSVTSYAEKPETHRVHNVGEQLFHRIAIGNQSNGAETESDDVSGLGAMPELLNKYYRVYRVSLAPGQATATHKHAWPTVVVQQTPGRLAVEGSRPTVTDEPGNLAFYDGRGTHTVKNTGTTSVEAVEVEVRGASATATPYNEATALLERYVAERKIAGAVAAVAQGGTVEYLKAVGVQDLETRAPMTERTLFRIYSMTKPITAVAAMMLIEEGRAALGDPVSKYLPEFKQVVVALPDGATRPPTRAITVEDLLLHTSGLSHRTSDLYRTRQVRSRAVALPRFVESIVRVPLMEDPGTRFRYSEGTTVVGRLVEIWSGRPLDQFLAERIFQPLRMQDTTFLVRPADRARLATVYAPAPSGLTPIEIEEVPFTEKPALLEGAVGLVSTVPDFLRFSQMLLNRGELDGVRILEATTVDRMTRNGLSDAVQKARGGSMGWGLANVNVLLDASAQNRGEYGWDGTAGTIFWIDPARRRIVILMTQSSPANPEQIRQRFKAAVN